MPNNKRLASTLFFDKKERRLKIEIIFIKSISKLERKMDGYQGL